MLPDGKMISCNLFLRSWPQSELPDFDFWLSSSGWKSSWSPSNSHTPLSCRLNMSYRARGGSSKVQTYSGKGRNNSAGRPKHHEDRTAQLPKSLLEQIEGPSADNSESLPTSRLYALYSLD